MDYYTGEYTPAAEFGLEFSNVSVCPECGQDAERLNGSQFQDGYECTCKHCGNVFTDIPQFFGNNQETVA